MADSLLHIDATYFNTDPIYGQLGVPKCHEVAQYSCVTFPGDSGARTVFLLEKQRPFPLELQQGTTLLDSSNPF